MPQVTGTKRARAYLGIDPGLSGGMTVIDREGRPKGFLEFASVTEHWIAEWLQKMSGRFELKAAIEDVHSLPKQGVVAMFTFGKSLGLVRGIIIGAKIPFVEVAPQKWQNFFAITKRGKKSKVDHKKLLQTKAHQLFPAYVKEISRGVADSTLIAEWLRREELRVQ